MEGFPYKTIPSGWYQAEHSSQIQIGTVKPVRLFGEDLVIYRDATGHARVMDAYCRHMGAHLGHGGVVEGECIRCPYHGWKWDGQGNNVEIPYHDQPIRERQMRVWPVRERSGAIFVWYDATGAAPSWEPPGIPEFEAEDFHQRFFVHEHVFRGLRHVPQVQMENLADFAHFRFVHRSAKEAEIVKLEFDGPMARVVLRNYYGSGRGSKYTGEAGYLVGENFLEAWGLGTIHGRHETIRKMIVLAGWTPVDGEHLDQFVMSAVAREPGDGDEPPDVARKLWAVELEQANADQNIFVHMRYEPDPICPPSEAAGFEEVRLWAMQFYPAEVTAGG